MVQEPELEEGESCYYKDDANIDPDIALSYIGDKVQSILGHFQKDFEGGVSAENLGAKFGGYGSFLPMHQRSPSILSRPKTPQRVQNPHLLQSPNACPEGPAPNYETAPDAPSTQGDGSFSSPSMHTSQTVKTSYNDASIRQNSVLPSDKVAKNTPGKVDLPSSKPINPLKVLIKVGSERVAQYNAEIYNLGLTSPSSSEGNSRDENDELLFDSHEKTSNESAADMLKIMTSFPVSGGLLLSPLCEDLLNLAREVEYPVESEPEAVPKSSTISVRILNNDAYRENKVTYSDKTKNSKKLEDKFLGDFNGSKQRTLDLDANNMEYSVQPLHELNCNPSSNNPVREFQKDVKPKKKSGSKNRLKERAVSADWVKDASLEYNPGQSSAENIARISQKNVSVDQVQGSRNHAKGNNASLKTYSDRSEGEGIKKAMDYLSSEVGTPHAVNRLSSKGGKKSKGSQSSEKLTLKVDNLRSGGEEKNHRGKKDALRLHLSQNDSIHPSTEHNMEKPKHSLKKPFGDTPKNFKFNNIVKAKSAHADKVKENLSNKKYFDKFSSDANIEDPPVPAMQLNEGTFNGLEQPVVVPVVIKEDWVACDRCEKWRLLPYGTKSEQLPDKWVCSMLDWLPGMNHCDISEDDTTKALQALYLVPVPDNQHNFQGHVDGTMDNAHHCDQNHQNGVSDQMKKHKLRQKLDIVSMSDPVPSIGKTKLQRLAVKNGSSKELKRSLVATNKSDTNKPAIASAKSKKRKGEHVIGDDGSLRKKIKKESAQHVNGNVKKIKPASTVDNFQSSVGNIDSIGQSLPSGLPNKPVLKDGNKKGNFDIYLKKQKDQMQGSSDNVPLGVKICNSRDVASKKLRLKEFAYSQHQAETQQNNGSNLQDRKFPIKEESNDGDFHRDKKPRVSLIEEEEFNKSQGDDLSNKRSAEAGVRSLGSKEYQVNKGIDKELNVRKPKAKSRLTIEDIDKLRMDLGCEHQSTAATSSSSKVSNSRKNRTSYVEVKNSPEESVSSSPIRMPYMNQVMMGTVEKVDYRLNNSPSIVGVKKIRYMKEDSDLGIDKKGTSGLTNDNGSEILDSKNKIKEETNIDNSHFAQVSSNTRHSDVKSVRNGSKSVGKKRVLAKASDSRSQNPNQDFQDYSRSSIERVSTHMEPWNAKLRITRPEDKQGALGPTKHASESSASLKRTSMDSRPLDACVDGDILKAPKDTVIASRLQSGTHNFVNNAAEQSAAVEGSLGNKNITDANVSTNLKEAEDVLKEADELRSHADLIKNSGFISESNYEYFEAALKFFHGASLLETCNGNHVEMSPMQMYGVAAQLYKTCAYEYEKGQELAVAALAYKCVEVAYLRVVYCKSSTTHRVWHDLKSSLQMVPQGESPSSSASDVDNLNNLATADKATLSKASGSHAGNHVMVPCNRTNFVRLLDFTKDVNSAMEAAKKSRDAFAAAHVKLEESQNKDAIISVKRVIDFSFQNVEELVRLVRNAFNTINHQGITCSKE